jgi:hypothetical protein
VQPDTAYYFRITHRDVNGARPDLVTPIPMQSLFTGVQSIGDVVVETGTNSASLRWDANVIGNGHVEYGIGSVNEASIADAFNVSAHQFELTGLLAGTTYRYRVSNRHAIDGDVLAEKTGTFRTLTSMPDAVEAIDALGDFVAALGLPKGTSTSLRAKLTAALEAAEAGDIPAACAALQDFLNEVRAQAGKKLTTAQAKQLTNRARDIRVRLGC